MIGDTITFDYAGSSLVLTKITEGGYSSEYLLKEASAEFRLQIRHSKENSKTGGLELDRHNVTITRQVYPDVDFPNGLFHQAYMVIRTPRATDGTDTDYLASALSDLLAVVVSSKTIQKRVIGWES